MKHFSTYSFLREHTKRSFIPVIIGLGFSEIFTFIWNWILSFHLQLSRLEPKMLLTMESKIRKIFLTSNFKICFHKFNITFCTTIVQVKRNLCLINNWRYIALLHWRIFRVVYIYESRAGLSSPLNIDMRNH